MQAVDGGGGGGGWRRGPAKVRRKEGRREMEERVEEDKRIRGKMKWKIRSNWYLKGQFTGFARKWLKT